MITMPVVAWMSAQPPAAAQPAFTATAAPSTSDPATRTEDPSPAPTASPAAPNPSESESRSLLDAIPALSGSLASDYDRALFGQAWYDEDGNGCDTRNDILRRDLTDLNIKADSNGCKVLEGVLVDPYSLETIAFTSGTDTSVLVQIDHLIPLAWAWRHGADAWSDDQRRAFANDPANLKATDGSLNMSKSDSGPADWMPPAREAHCAYAEDFVSVLSDWDLPIGDADRRALEIALDRCP
ncbi:hypothetical protein GCM10009796_13950 [Microbacterium koreense]